MDKTDIKEAKTCRLVKILCSLHFTIILFFAIINIYSSDVTIHEVMYNLFVTSKNELSDSPIYEFKVLHKSQRAF